MPYTVINGVKKYYEVVGEGEPLFLLNGAFMSTESWIMQTRVLSKRYKVCLQDFRGQWRSGKPERLEDYGVDKDARDLKDLMDKLGIEKASFVGTSYGGAVALYFASTYPDRVRCLVTINTTARIDCSLKLKIMRWMNGALTGDPLKFTLSWINDVYSDEFLNKYGWGFIENIIKRFSAGFDFKSAAMLLEATLRLEKENMLEHLKTIEAPTLVVASDNDRVMPPYFSAEINNAIKNSELVVLENASHGVVIEKPDLINTLILGFLARVIQR